jgi:anhydro-N-acetylmuramic acid kinase
MEKDYYIGLMSGTSLDAIDAVLVDFAAARPRLIASHQHELTDTLRSALLDLCQPGENEIERLGIIDIQLGKAFAAAAQQLLSAAGISATEVSAIGSHGQTIRHRPETGFTLQIGDPNTIAERTGITTVADFRRRDLAAGGQGAPLVPAFHAAVFGRHKPEDETVDGGHPPRVILNIGGMANVTLLIPGLPVTGFDTGPGNVLMDAWIQQQQQLPCDHDGAWAQSGAVNAPLLAALQSDDYFRQPAPKSTGRERFNLAWLQQHLAAIPDSLPDEDVQATLCALTAVTVAAALHDEIVTAGGEILVCGGGAHNGHLLAQLERLLPDYTIKTTDAVGLAPDWVEACAFAWLARETLARRPGNVPTVTGARRPVILGGIYPAV